MPNASRAIVTLGTSGKELRDILLTENLNAINVPLPSEKGQTNQTARIELEGLLNSEHLGFRVRYDAPANSRSWAVERYPAHGRFKMKAPSGPMANIRADRGTAELHVLGLTNQNADQELAYPLAEILTNRIYLFHAERLQLAVHPFGESSVLSPNASNLPEVLNVLQGNPAMLKELNALVSTVIPSVKQVTVRPTVNRSLEILVWSIDPETKRDDLAMPLSDCGTGVGQVLAMLYVVLTSPYPRTILIDEPASFLHPGAARKLISIFQRFPEHQYVISTHSPEIVSFVRDAPTFLVTWKESESNVQQIDSSQLDDARALLTELGAKLSDVYGADNIVWVEGPTEEECLQLIALKYALGDAGTIFLAVREPDRLRSGRDKQRALDLYRRLSTGGALIPPAVGFLFDREGLSDRDVEDLERQHGVRVLPRRMFENYLLDANAIAAALNQTATFRDRPIDAALVEAALREKIGTSPVKEVDGARILQELFEELSETVETYRKIEHGAAITRYLLENNRAYLEEVALILRGFLGESVRVG